jgi:hypothetical protein
MTSPLETRPDSRADNRADIARVLVAIGLLALIASFADADKPRVEPVIGASSSGLPIP